MWIKDVDGDLVNSSHLLNMWVVGIVRDDQEIEWVIKGHNSLKDFVILRSGFQTKAKAMESLELLMCELVVL